MREEKPLMVLGLVCLVSYRPLANQKQLKTKDWLREAGSGSGVHDGGDRARRGGARDAGPVPFGREHLERRAIVVQFEIRGVQPRITSTSPGSSRSRAGACGARRGTQAGAGQFWRRGSQPPARHHGLGETLVQTDRKMRLCTFRSRDR